MRLNEATEKRELARLKLQQLKKLQELELKKLRVKGEEDTLRLQNEYEQAILSERIWGHAEEVMSQEEKQEMPKLISQSVKSPMSKEPLPFIPANYLERKRDIGITKDVKGENGEADSRVNKGSKPSSSCLSPPQSDANVGGQEILKGVVGILNEGFNMPKPELLTFDGNPLHYWRFINNFETNIANETTNLRKRLAYLIQHCKGDAREAIENCSILDPVKGYGKAREILEQQFGRRHVVAQSHIKQIVDGVQIKSFDGTSLQKLARQMQNCELTLTKMGWSEELNNSETLLRIVDRLPSFMQLKWAEKAEAILKSERRPQFSDLAQFIQDRANVAANMFGKHALEARKKVTKDPPKARIKETARATTLATVNKEISGENKKTAISRCLLCSHDHELSKCDEFRRKSYEERVQIVRTKRICNNCFKPGHFARGCLEKKSCELPECRRKHHTLLHPPNPGPVTSSQKNQAIQVDAGSSGVYSVTNSKHRDVCLRIVPVKVGSPDGQKVETYALLDSGSEVSLCDRRLIDKLGLDGVRRRFSLTTLNEETRYRNGLEVDLEVSSLNNEHSISLERVWSVDALPVSSKAIPVEDDLKKWTHLSDLEFPRIEAEDVMLLIGADTPEAFWVMEEKRGERGEPCAIKSPLGWTLFGPTTRFKDSENGMVNLIRREDDQLQRQLEMFWKTDFGDSLADDRKSMSVEDCRALKIMNETATKVEGHYQVALPWRNFPPNLQNNRQIAESRLLMLKKRLLKDDEVRRKYVEVVDSYLNKGYARKVPQDELQQNDGSVWYLPHHALVQPQKGGKVRVVFDCAAKFKGTSLNDKLLRGPDFNNNLVGVLLRFREHSIAIVSDIREMFHQVRVYPKDSDALRFLWWPSNDLTKDAEDYQMQVHIFGAVSSPSCTGFCLKKTADDNCEKFDLETIKTVKRNFYVDDCLKSTQTVVKAQRLVRQLIDLLALGGFHLTKWISNSEAVMATISNEEKAPSVVNLDSSQLIIERALGVQWNVRADEFNIKITKQDKPSTRRGILSVMSSVYDPLGFVAPFVLTAKRILQDLCKERRGWDEELEEKELQRWENWYSDLECITKISIARCVKPAILGEAKYLELHHFSDASQYAYGVVSYLRIENTLGQVHCSFLFAKSRLAPLKAISIPRLELSAAALAVKLNRMIQDELDLEIGRTVFWSDSTAVLQYIANTTKRFNTFVANRLAIIHDGSSPDQWKYVETNSNPADYATRGLTAKEMIKADLWFKGPTFLWELEENWPLAFRSVPEITDEDPEVKSEVQCHSIVKQEEFMNKIIHYCSSLQRLKKGTAWLTRYKEYIVHTYRARSGKIKELKPLRTSDLTVEELTQAEEELVKFVQGCVFRKELAILNSEAYRLSTSQRKLKSIGPLYKLNPVLQNGILRVGGRLSNAPIDVNAKHPSILPNKHHLTDLIVQHYHRKLGHAGREHVLSSIRERYWIVRGRVAVRRAIGRCLRCERRNAVPRSQIMADLPIDRVQPDKPPFTYVGVDFFGPLFVKQGRSRIKRYGCLFTCLVLRAVHIEIAHSLDVSSFIDALRRFIARRGKPEEIRSDRGTNFVGAERELRESLEKWNDSQLNDFLCLKEIKWKFNPAAASHMGGAWERLIRSVKKILKALLNEQLVNDETLLTTMAEVEAILNSRPITSNSDSPFDAEALTPNHLLMLRSDPKYPPGVFTKKDHYVKRRWRQVQYLANIFWRRWLKEYLPTLQMRQKWCFPEANLKENDVVLMVNENVPRGQWPLARIVKVHLGRDGKVRSAVVRSSGTDFTRPITKLCVLENVNLAQADISD